MAIGTSKVGALGGLVPGGTETFNASGTFVVPPGVKKVSITGSGGAGNPGNTGTAGNSGNPGSGGGGGSGGRSLTPTANDCPTCPGPFSCRLRQGGWAWKASSFLVDAGPFNSGSTPFYNTVAVPGGGTPPSYTPKQHQNPGTTGCAGTGGSAGSTGNPGNSGCASTGLCQTFPGGAGGNGGAAGNAGTGGAGGTGGGSGNAATTNSAGNGGGAGNNAGSGGVGVKKPATYAFCGSPSILRAIGGAGGGGAGVNTSGLPATSTPASWGTTPTYNPWFESPRNPNLINPTRPTLAGSSVAGGAGGAGTLTYNSGCWTTWIGYGGSGQSVDLPGSFFPTPALPGVFTNAFVNKPAPFGPDYNDNIAGNSGTLASVTRVTSGPGLPNTGWEQGIYRCCRPVIPVQHRRIVCNVPLPARQNGARAGGGGGLGAGRTFDCPFPPVLRPANATTGSGGGGGGGGRGAAGNAGGCGGAGNAGSPGTPATYNCVPVTPGSPYPIVVSCGGQVVISWNPQ